MRDVQQIKVLIFDSNQADARFLQLLLEDTSMVQEVVLLTEIKDFRPVFEDLKPELVLFDVGINNSRKQNFLTELIVDFEAYFIVTTARSNQEEILKTLETGAHDYLLKGQFTRQDLLMKVQISLYKTQHQQQLTWFKKMSQIESWYFDTATEKIVFPNVSFHQNLLNLNAESIPLLKKKMKERIEEAMEDGGLLNHSVFLAEPDNYFQLTIKPLFSKGGDGIIKGILQDVTDIKKSEKLLGENHQKYIDIFSNSSDGIYLSSILGHPKECNRSGLEMFGLTKEKLSKINFHRLLIGEKADAVLIDIGFKKPIKNREIEIIREDGSRRSCLISVVYFSDQKDVYTGIIRDITERKIAEKIKRTRALEIESNQLKEEFIAGISHEMRTPMNAIVGLSNLILDTNLNDEQRGYLKSIHYASDQLLGILNDILDISSLQNGETRFESKNFDIHDMLNNLVHNLSYKLIDKPVRLELAIDPDLPVILKGDKLRINQILFNLAGNAVKFTEVGYVKLSCSLLGQSGDSVLVKFAIEDTGIGIPANKQDAIFESFTRIKYKEKSYEGTGLGLAISKNLIEQQGGKIWVKSELNKGSTFFFDMVLELGEEPQKINEIVYVDDTVIVNPNCILIVEDNKMNQLVAKKLLAKRWPEMEILLANNGKEAMEVVEGGVKIDIVLMDLNMPVMNGYEATLAIRAHPKAAISSLPVLAMTADAQIQKGDKFKIHQLDGFIVKPFDPGLLYEKILLHLNQTKV